MDPDEEVRKLRDKQIDAGFLYLPVDETGLDVRTVLREPLIVALPDMHPLVAQERVAMRQLADEPFILPPRPRNRCESATLRRPGAAWRRVHGVLT